MGTARLQFQTDQRPVPPAAQHPVLCAGGLAVGTDHLFHEGAGLRPKRGVDDPGGRVRDPLAHRQIDPAEVLGVELTFQQLLGVGVLGGNQQAGGPPVQPVDGVKIRLLPRRFVIMHQKIT